MTPGASLPALFHAAYLLSAILFIVGLKFLSSPARARRGNGVAALAPTRLVFRRPRAAFMVRSAPRPSPGPWSRG